MAADSIRAAQTRYRRSYDRSSREVNYKVGDWVLVRFPQEETGRMRKLSRPWHRPYRVVDRRDPDVTAVKVYSPQDGQIQVHQNRVAPCPPELPSGFYWYGTRRSRPGRPPKWVGQLLQGDLFTSAGDTPGTNEESTDEPPGESASAETNDGRVDGDPPGADYGPESEAVPLGGLEGQILVTPHPILQSLTGEVSPDLPAVVGDGEAVASGADGMQEMAPTSSMHPARCPESPQRRYGLRSKTQPPARLMRVCSGTSIFRGGRGVTLSLI